MRCLWGLLLLASCASAPDTSGNLLGLIGAKGEPAKPVRAVALRLDGSMLLENGRELPPSGIGAAMVEKWIDEQLALHGLNLDS